jgi:hypothetical protein
MMLAGKKADLSYHFYYALSPKEHGVALANDTLASGRALCQDHHH